MKTKPIILHKRSGPINYNLNIYFSDFFNVKAENIEKYGAFNISLINDLPLFIDPFLLFNSPKPEYQELHKSILSYLRFLKDASSTAKDNNGLLMAWYCFPEVKQNWFGYSLSGNKGSGLGMVFANFLNHNLFQLFNDSGENKISQSRHLEKLCLIKEGIGKDNISDFATNLIKKYLLEYTETFAKNHIDKSLLKEFVVDKVQFNYKTEVWESNRYILPNLSGDFVLLTPKDLLTKDDTWINRTDLVSNFTSIAHSIPNESLRSQINNYFLKVLPDKPSEKAYKHAVSLVIEKYPQILDYFISQKEINGKQAKNISNEKVKESEFLYIGNIKEFVEKLLTNTHFYDKSGDSYSEAFERVSYLKQVIENNDGYRIFYYDGKPIKREQDLQILYRLTWFASSHDVNREVNNGRGPVDYKISKGSSDKTLVEFKLASNKKLKQNLANQVEVYQKANETDSSLKVIIYFNDSEFSQIQAVLKELKLDNAKNIILIDASPNKTSASNVK